MTETPAFRPGDRVKCIWGAEYNNLIKGNEYVVERTRGLMVKLEGQKDYQLWDPSRFEKVEKPEQDDTIRVGDTVECVDASPGVFGRTLTLGRHYRVARSTVYVRDDGGGERGFSSSRFRKVVQPELVTFAVTVREPANSLSIRSALENHNFYVESVERQ